MSGSLLAQYRGPVTALHSLTHDGEKVAVNSPDVAERYRTSLPRAASLSQLLLHSFSTVRSSQVSEEGE